MGHHLTACTRHACDAALGGNSIPMDAERKLIGELEFWLVGSLQLRRTATGKLEEYTHHFDSSVRTNAYAEGPFCSFSLPHAPRAEGVYAIEVAGELRYIGECRSLASRFSATGYGQIAPRNCHSDGQSTNCKLNAHILAAAKDGKSTTVWFHPTSEYKTVERNLILDIAPPWNGRKPREPSVAIRSRRKGLTQPPANHTEERPPTAADFSAVIEGLLQNASAEGKAAVSIEAGELHRLVGGYPKPHNRMPMCCAAMRASMKDNDRFIHQPPKGNGASLKIEYRFPR